jgi:hypothetical protein
MARLAPERRLPSLVLLVAVIVSSTVGMGIAGPGAAASDRPTGDIEFHPVSNETGFNYTTTINYGAISNAGVYANDFDRDGWTDLLAIGGEEPILFENTGGEFTPSGQLSAVDRELRAALFLDYDNDGWQDLLLLAEDSEPIFLENDGGDLERTDVGLDTDMTIPMGAAAGDYTGNGCLDLFVFQNGDWNKHLPRARGTLDNEADVDNGNPNYLFRGDCEGFENVTAEAGIRGTRWSLAASTVDLDEDGRPDVHVANDFNYDIVYWNQGDGTFEQDVLGEATNRNGMASAVADVNGDGYTDIYVTNIYFPETDTNVSRTYLGTNERAGGNNLLINRGNRSFEDRAAAYGVRKGGWGWAATFTDLDNDVDLDLLHTTLYLTAFPAGSRNQSRELMGLIREDPVYRHPALFERVADGERPYVRRNSSAAGFLPVDGRGGAKLDYDRDGDVDFAIAASAGMSEATSRLYENRGATGEALQVTLVPGDGETPVGSRVSVRAEDRTRSRTFLVRSDYLAQHTRILHFGAGDAGTADVRVVRPDGSEQQFRDVSTGQRLVIGPDGIEQRIPLDGEPSGAEPCLPGICPGPGALPLAVLSGALIGVLALGYRWYADSE